MHDFFNVLHEMKWPYTILHLHLSMFNVILLHMIIIIIIIIKYIYNYPIDILKSIYKHNIGY